MEAFPISQTALQTTRIPSAPPQPAEDGGILDLGRTMTTDPGMRMLVRENPAMVPEIQSLVRARMVRGAVGMVAE
jgi:hypothetical protein